MLLYCINYIITQYIFMLCLRQQKDTVWKRCEKRDAADDMRKCKQSAYSTQVISHHRKGMFGWDEA